MLVSPNLRKFLTTKGRTNLKIINSSVEILDKINAKEILDKIEIAGRTCWASEPNSTPQETFLKNIINRKHESVLEHASITVRFICDRGVTHEIVRHRIASYSQQSTRYCNYTKDKFGNEITVIKPAGLDEDSELYALWKQGCEDAERNYFALVNAGAKPDLARGVLPTDVKTILVMTANIREWRHFFALRCDEAAHPNIRVLAKDLLHQFKEQIPILFDDIDF